AVSVVQSGLGPPELAITFGFAAWAVLWVWYWTRALGRSRTAEITGFAGLVVILCLFALMAPQPVGVGGVFVFAFVVAGVTFPVRRAAWVLAGLSVLEVSLMVFREYSLALTISGFFNSLLVGAAGMGARLLWQAYTQLLAAREQLAQVAVGEERLRFARDLHDLLGQNLAVLVLKSELVAKQLPEDADEGVRQGMRDIAQVARKSLNDVREAVAGYRRPTLAAEISNARGVLRAAGIGFLVEDRIGPLPAEQDTVLAWCLREAVTNVVRHSGAATCEARLSRVDGIARFELTDDGRGATDLEGGSGLAGMRERVETVGGTVDVGPKGRGGLLVRIAVPVSLPPANGAAAV
ncbi:MAG TPA: sensor histidine kinase, partial [Patescibacteria group bacterium]|nr:sensor histidine kinase [Patescibacteria group bacterium]